MTSDDASVPVAALVATIKEAVRRGGISRSRGQRDLSIKSIQLILQTFASGESGGELDFRVPIIGVRLGAEAKITSKNIHTIDMTLKPGRPPREVRSGSVDEALANAILTIRRTIALAAEGDDPWVLSAGTVDISFGVTRSGSISLGARGELVDAFTHTLRVILAPASPDEV